MTGFQIFLCVLLGIIALFVVILSIPVHVTLGYDDKIRLSVRYLFIKLNILPASSKPKKEKPEKEKPEEEKTEEKPPKEKKPNPIIEMVKANGYDGMMTVLANLKRILGIYGGKIFKSIIFNELFIDITVSTGDSAATAIKYGKTCQNVFPVMGYLCSNYMVKKYDINVQPDFLANKTDIEFHADIKLCLRKIINSTIGMAVRLIFGVVLKFLKGAKQKSPQKPKQAVNK